MKTHTTLISARELLQHVYDPRWRIFDCRHDLANPLHGCGAFRRGHIPGARFLHMDDDLSGRKTGVNGRHPLPPPHEFAARMAASGMNDCAQAVVYDDAGGAFAVRLWWMLRWLGHERVAVLDGGIGAWKRAGGVLGTQPTPPAAGRFSVRAHRTMCVRIPELTARLDDPATVLIDARSPERYSGEQETLDPVAGHIPGAVNRFYQDNLDDLQCFRPADELREEFGQLIDGRSPRQVIHSCGSGVTACHNLLAMEHAGLSGSRLYPGSWSEWCSDPARPMVRPAVPI
jgi:thiosulfate/3-mercaptopyruvate sulfurtransferase